MKVRLWWGGVTSLCRCHNTVSEPLDWTAYCVKHTFCSASSITVDSVTFIDSQTQRRASSPLWPGLLMRSHEYTNRRQWHKSINIMKQACTDFSLTPRKIHTVHPNTHTPTHPEAPAFGWPINHVEREESQGQWSVSYFNNQSYISQTAYPTEQAAKQTGGSEEEITA